MTAKLSNIKRFSKSEIKEMKGQIIWAILISEYRIEKIEGRVKKNR